MPRRRLSLVALLLVLPGLAACDSGDSENEEGGPGGHLSQALDVVPGDAESVLFVDRGAMAERLGVADADVDIDDYAEKTRDDAVGGTELMTYLAVMADDAAFDERDVEWSVSADTADGRADVYRVADDVDLDRFGDDLVEAGLDDTETQGRRHLAGSLADVVSTSGVIGDAYPQSFYDVTVDADEHLVIVGFQAEAVLDVIDGDADSLGDTGVFDDVLDGADAVEYADLSTAPACAGSRSPADGPPEAIERLDLPDLQTPEVTAYLVAGDLETSARLAFADEERAETDLEARTTYLDDGLLIATAQPFSDVGTARLERDGSVVRVDLDLEHPAQGRQIAYAGDGFLACTPG